MKILRSNVTNILDFDHGASWSHVFSVSFRVYGTVRDKIWTISRFMLVFSNGRSNWEQYMYVEDIRTIPLRTNSMTLLELDDQ